MIEKASGRNKTTNLRRRDFLQKGATAAVITCLTPGMFSESANHLVESSTRAPNPDALDEALEMMAKLAPLTNHGPMAAEALVTMGRPDAVVGFVEGYKKRFTSIYPPTKQSVTKQNWREALGDGSRVADWSAFFRQELEESSWSQVLEKWSAVLAPGLAAAAAHGLIRTGHAVRSLSIRENELRRRELAEGLGYWAAYYQPLPEKEEAASTKFKPDQAVSHIPILPTEKRASNGSIMIGLHNLSDFPQFGVAANLLDITGKLDQLLSQVTEAFATEYIRNVNQRNFVTLIHTVTGTTALRPFLPYLTPSTSLKMFRYTWQIAAALYSIASIGSLNKPPQPGDLSRANLINRAVMVNEEHAIKFSEACMSEYELNPRPCYLEAARDAIDRLGPAKKV